MRQMNRALSAFVNELTGVEFDFAAEYAEVWLNGGRTPELRFYAGLRSGRAYAITETIKRLQPFVPFARE